MKSLNWLFSGLRDAYNDINPSTLTGAIDVVVVEQEDGTFTCGPFYVRFGKLTAISPAYKSVEVRINDNVVEWLSMELDSDGGAYFVRDHEFLEEKVRCFDSLTPTNIRRRRRKARRTFTMSESDAFTPISLTPRSEEKFSGPQSDCELSEFSDEGRVVMNYYASDGNLNKNKSAINDDANFKQKSTKSQENVHYAAAALESSSFYDLENVNHPSQDIQQMDTEGVYLEDLVQSEVDQNVKETYIYPPSNPLSQPQSVFQSNLEGCCVDAGYRSDGENSAGSHSPLYPSINGVQLSLCGCPTMDSDPSEEEFFQHLVSYEEFIQDPHGILSNPKLAVQLNRKYYNWPVAASSIVSVLAFRTELPHRTLHKLQSMHMVRKQPRTSWFSWTSRKVPSTGSENTVSQAVSSIEVAGEADDTVQKNSQLHDAPEQSVEDTEIRTNRLSSEEIASLDLKPGRNDLEFRITTKYQGTCICFASIYRWRWHDKIIISDVDGTITRSDILGHILPMLGRDWTHDGVAGLYDSISKNGYRFLYLSSRALGQAGITRSYLRQVMQEASITLPDGPIILSPHSLLHAFHREVIEKNPEVVKIECLDNVRSLFPKNTHPFYAGFGNKVNDVNAYEASGIERLRIFTINPRGEVRNEFHTVKLTTYTELTNMVDHYFPRVLQPKLTSAGQGDRNGSSVAGTDLFARIPIDLSSTPSIDASKFSLFTYWRTSENLCTLTELH